jgi:hypothetical protein
MVKSPSAPDMVVYWITRVGIGEDPEDYVAVPLTDILDYRRADGAPQVTVTILSSASFTGTPETFAPPYWDLGALAEVLPPRTADVVGPVQMLQAQGIKVLLCVAGSKGMGWDLVPAAQNGDFAQWVQSEILELYGLDGIDIDDEWGPSGSNPQGLVDTVAALRAAAPQALITKALWSDNPDYFTTPVSADSPWSPGAYLGQLVDFGSTMAYGENAAGLEATVQSYTSITTPGGANVGLAPNQLCIGVQAGVGSWFTTLADSEAAAAWVVQNGYRGMMLFTFSQDIQQWTHQPVNSPDYMWRNPNDHAWQRGMIAAMGLAPSA